MEILDLEELKVKDVDENLKVFMSKDEEVSKLLNDKIDEIISETEKLNEKEEEIRGLEEASREKISMDATPDELIEIAEKIKSAQSELSEINGNIEKLESEKEELENTRNDVNNSKMEYIKNLTSTNSNYQEQITKIEEAIKVCDNPSLKQVLEDVKIEKENALESLQEERNKTLNTALNLDDETNNDMDSESISQNIEISETEDDEVSDNIVNEVPNIELPNDEISNIVSDDDIKLNIEETTFNDENNVSSFDTISKVEDDINLKQEIPEINEESTPNLNESSINLDILPNAYENIKLEQENNVDDKSLNNNVIGLDSILSNDVNASDDVIIMPKLNNVETDKIEIPKAEEEKTKIIFSKNVPVELIKEIFSSSTIMPNVYNYLGGNNIISGGILL